MELVPTQLQPVKVFALPLGHESYKETPKCSCAEPQSHWRRVTQPVNWSKAKGKGRKSQKSAGMKENLVLRHLMPHCAL